MSPVTTAKARRFANACCANRLRDMPATTRDLIRFTRRGVHSARADVNQSPSLRCRERCYQVGPHAGSPGAGAPLAEQLPLEPFAYSTPTPEALSSSDTK